MQILDLKRRPHLTKGSGSQTDQVVAEVTGNRKRVNKIRRCWGDPCWTLPVDQCTRHFRCFTDEGGVKRNSEKQKRKLQRRQCSHKCEKGGGQGRKSKGGKREMRGATRAEKAKRPVLRPLTKGRRKPKRE